MFDHRVNYFSFYQENQDKFKFDKNLADEPVLLKFTNDLNGYADFSNPYFNKFSYKQKEKYDNSIFPAFDILTSLTSYENKNSIQKEKGSCSKVRD
jgi:hypothetical protein